MLNLYEKLAADGEPTVAQLITERRQENISLEFKTKANVGTGEPNRDDRRNLGIALSAFSNPMGGLIVWGVRTEKNADNVDCATEVRPIGGDRALQGGCNSPFFTNGYAPPRGHLRRGDLGRKPTRWRVPGDLCRAIRAAAYRCGSVEKQYFKRVGDSSIAMEH